ncbi:hypothetical protein QUB80_33100 [Chlorogloeopsis sp. ULAP01]|uniref:hypothetical protein n=1 Tax=Chlorogloeopsis sp. ULAP01 TaxID=3056483 RepID=UPI0025AAEBB4|nr:hypothetical protein [Chlorogloeopsis sp. ULAP01]MDM9385494.1 hypothetical protein [Chlorogloeopsis sp. ULAP01]
MSRVHNQEMTANLSLLPFAFKKRSQQHNAIHNSDACGGLRLHKFYSQDGDRTLCHGIHTPTKMIDGARTSKQQGSRKLKNF